MSDLVPEQGLTASHPGIVLACFLTCDIPSAMILSTAGLFYPLIASDLNVSTAQISAWMSVSMLASAFFSPIVGNLVARYNIRHFMLIGVLTAGLVLYIFSVGTEPWMFWLAGDIAGFSLVTCLALLPSVLVNRWFSKHVGLIIGLCTSFTGIGGVVFLAVGQGIIDAYGWRAAYLAFAIIAVVVCSPVVVLCVRDWPSDRGVQPFGVSESDGQDSADVQLAATSRDDIDATDQRSASSRPERRLARPVSPPAPPGYLRRSSITWRACRERRAENRRLSGDKGARARADAFGGVFAARWERVLHESGMPAQRLFPVIRRLA